MQFKIEPLTFFEKTLHEKAMKHAENYRRAEAELLKTIAQVDSYRLYYKFNVNSTFSYCVEYLKLSPAVTSNFINVARKSREVPELKLAVEAGELSVATARKIVPILNAENKVTWIKKAKVLPQSQLEREVAEISPARERERAKPVRNGRVELTLSISKEAMGQFKKVQDIESKNKSASFEDALVAAVECYLKKNDPLRKSPRMSQTHAAASNSRAIPAHVRHAVNQRDQRKCQSCGRTRFLQYHHIKPFQQGGPTTLENLATLCSSCHQRQHL